MTDRPDTPSPTPELPQYLRDAGYHLRSVEGGEWYILCIADGDEDIWFIWATPELAIADAERHYRATHPEGAEPSEVPGEISPRVSARLPVRASRIERAAKALVDTSPRGRPVEVDFELFNDLASFFYAVPNSEPADTTQGDSPPKVGSPIHVEVWDAIHDYAQACGGDPGRHARGFDKCGAVARVEAAILAYRQAAPQGDSPPDVPEWPASFPCKGDCGRRAEVERVERQRDRMADGVLYEQAQNRELRAQLDAWHKWASGYAGAQCGNDRLIANVDVRVAELEEAEQECEQLRARVAELEGWKAQASTVMSEWDDWARPIVEDMRPGTSVCTLMQEHVAELERQVRLEQENARQEGIKRYAERKARLPDLRAALEGGE